MPRVATGASLLLFVVATLHSYYHPDRENMRWSAKCARTVLYKRRGIPLPDSGRPDVVASASLWDHGDQ
jgi:hypothetical protein